MHLTLACLGIDGHDVDMPAVRGQAIRKAYEDRGLTREEFADATGIPAKTVTNISNGAPTSWSRVARIASTLGWKQSLVLANPDDAKHRIRVRSKTRPKDNRPDPAPQQPPPPPPPRNPAKQEVPV